MVDGKESPKDNSKVFGLGDAVEVVGAGMVGVIVGQDASSTPYLIKLDNGLVSWYSICSFRATDAKPKPKDETVEDVPVVPVVVEDASAEKNNAEVREIQLERIEEGKIQDSQVEPLLEEGATDAAVSLAARKDAVEIVATGMIGTIVGQDESLLPYLIKLDNGLVSWYSKDQVQAKAKDATVEDVSVDILQTEPIMECNSANNNVSWFCCK
jgi:hypothetical protein